MGRPKEENPMKTLNITITKEQYEMIDKQHKNNKSMYIRSLLEGNGNTSIINTELRELNEQMMKYRDLYNTLIQWLEDSKLGFTDLMVPSELEKLEGMSKW